MLGSPVPSLSWSFLWIQGRGSAGGTVRKLSVVSLISVSLLSQDALHGEHPSGVGALLGSGMGGAQYDRDV